MAETIRVFISSPGDVRDAREVAAQTTQKVAQDYLRYFRVEPYMWETEVLVSSGHFQDAIEPPSQFDIVTLIVWSRLGTPLPEQTAARRYEGIDGRTPVTGTEWEYEDALKAARSRKVPDILVYRSRRPASVDTWDAAQRDDQLHQLKLLDAFWTRHFADGKAFIGAYNEYSDLDAFAVALEAHLRQLLDKRLLDARGQLPSRGRPTWTRPPFNGLDSYTFDQAEIFFGRAEAAGKAIGQLIDNAERGSAFLLALGASGSGKSSLLKAGVAPGLWVPRRVTGKSFQRRVYFRPGDRIGPEGLIEAFARSVASNTPDQPSLVELGDPTKLAHYIREAPAQGHALFQAALDRVTATCRASGAMLQFEEAAMLVVVDQLEEMFTDTNVSPTERSDFIELLASLARSGRVWIVAGMRSDFWHRAQELPGLVALAEGFGRLDVLPPRPGEISQMIRLPAEAAGLQFDQQPVTRIALNDQIAEDATGAPGALPLLSYVLEQLYHSDCVEAGGSVLTFATYDALGGLKGAVGARADVVMAKLDADVQASLPEVLLALVQSSCDERGTQTLTARGCPLDNFDPEGPARRLVDSFLAPDARLFVADSSDDRAATVRIAHEALLTEWREARECLAENALLLQIKGMVESRFIRAQEMSSSNAGLLAGVDLFEAERLLGCDSVQLSHGLVDFIRRSKIASRNARVRLYGLMIGIIALAAIASTAAILAIRSAGNASTQFDHVSFLDAERDGDAAIHEKRYDDAVMIYANNIAIARRLVAHSPGDGQLRYNLAREYASLGLAIMDRNRPGDPTEAQLQFHTAKELADELIGSPNASGRVRADAQSMATTLAKYLPVVQGAKPQR